jgi:hypothetical protein
MPAMSNAERQRRHRQRVKQAQAESVAPYVAMATALAPLLDSLVEHRILDRNAKLRDAAIKAAQSCAGLSFLDEDLRSRLLAALKEIEGQGEVK